MKTRRLDRSSRTLLTYGHATSRVHTCVVALLSFLGADVRAADPTFTLTKQLIASDGALSDHFGFAVSVSGDVAVVGAQDWDVAGNANQGSVYVFERSSGGADAWGEVTKLVASNGAAGDDFGYSVSVSGDLIFVGAPVDMHARSDQGSAYIFERNEGGPNTWGQVKKLTASDGAAGDQFGFSVSVSGDVVVVGAVVENGFRGAAYVFERNTGGANNWGQVKKLIAGDRAPDDQFGYAVSVSGDVVVVGAPVDNVGANSNQGSAYLFERNHGGANNWGQVKRLNADDGTAGDQLGFSVSVNGDVVVAGAVVDNGGRGSAYLFERNQGGANNWGQVKRLSASDAAPDDWFGYSVAVSGDVVMAGAPQESTGPGSAYVFERNQGGANNWGERQKLTDADGTVFDTFGLSVSVSGSVVLVGAVFDDVGFQDQGSAYLFALPQIRLLAPALVDGQFKLELTGPAGLVCSFQASSDLVQWTKVTDITLFGGPMAITVPAGAEFNFFRAITPPAP